MAKTRDYLCMGITDCASLGLRVAMAGFTAARNMGALNEGHLYITLGEIRGGEYVQHADDGYGFDMAHRLNPDTLAGADAKLYNQLKRNVSTKTGKLATVVEYRMDSVVAYHLFGENVLTGAKGWTGGVIHIARCHLTSGKWLVRIFAGAASGVQGVYDMATVYTALLHMAAAWAQHELALEAALPQSVEVLHARHTLTIPPGFDPGEKTTTPQFVGD